MGHTSIIVLVPKEKAINSFEARKLTLRTLEESEEKRLYGEGYEYSIGHRFSGLFSDICGGKAVVPYYNKEMRDIVRKGIDKIADFIKGEIEKTREVYILASEIKKEIPEYKTYNDGDLLDALRLEFKGIDINIAWHVKTWDVIYIFETSLQKLEFWEQFWEKNGRYEFVELGYEDDAMIINECLYREMVKEPERIIDIDIGPITKEDITPEKMIGKKWAVLVDAVD